MPRTPGRIFADGHRDFVDGLVAALRAPQDDDETADSLTHPFHTYPARLHPATARILVDIVGSTMKRPDALVDPFCGSGTVLVEARAAGIPAVGVDLNPLACLVARAKTWTAPGRARVILRDTGARISREVLELGKAARRAKAEPGPVRGPVGFDPNGRNRRLASWFQPHTRRELEAIASYIDDIREDNAELADVLMSCLSAILYKVSSRTSDTDGTWVDRNIARGNAARLFGQRVAGLCAGLDELASVPGTTPQVFEHDARRLVDIVPDGRAAGIVTSPPYAGTYDYAEHQRLRFDFLGLRHRNMDEGEIGSRRSFANEPEAYRRWREALSDTMAAITRALAPGAVAAIVVGDSTALNRAIYALDDIRDTITDELFLVGWASQQRPMLGGREARAFGDRPKAEHIVLLRRA